MTISACASGTDCTDGASLQGWLLPERLQGIAMSELVSEEQLKDILSAPSGKSADEWRRKADLARERLVGNKVFFRGIIEFSNICEKDCFYCGIRKGNLKVNRCRMSGDEIMDCALWAFKQGYGSIVLQSGEATGKKFVDDLIGIVSGIKRETKKIDPKGRGLGITLSVGEQKKKVYEELFEAGAHRYLLRIETSNKELYGKLHPEDCSFSNRVKCLKDLKEIGYQLGTGGMIGLPFQTIDDLAGDLMFYKEIDADMIGMGPYIMHKDTPIATYPQWGEDQDYPKTGEGAPPLRGLESNNCGWRKDSLLDLSLNTVAAARLFLGNVNIAATTALQTLHPEGRELALECGANIIMPVITPKKYRADYLLYDRKPCVDENAEQCRNCLAKRIEGIGRTVGWGEWGDSPHCTKRTVNNRKHDQTQGYTKS